MNVEFESSFLRDLKKLNDPELKKYILNLIDCIEKEMSFLNIKNVKKLKGHKTAYRIRIIKNVSRLVVRRGIRSTQLSASTKFNKMHNTKNIARQPRLQQADVGGCFTICQTTKTK